MFCPYCGGIDSKVIDSRQSDVKKRRRRECSACHKRFTTYEVVERPFLMVEKRDGTFEQFDREKLVKGVFSAIKKRPVSIEQVEEMVSAVESFCESEMMTTVTSRQIGEIILERLKNIDAIAYVRFASVYKDFTDVERFVAAIRQLSDRTD